MKALRSDRPERSALAGEDLEQSLTAVGKWEAQTESAFGGLGRVYLSCGLTRLQIMRLKAMKFWAVLGEPGLAAGG